jgi:hypothetical protein
VEVVLVEQVPQLGIATSMVHQIQVEVVAQVQQVVQAQTRALEFVLEMVVGYRVVLAVVVL